MASINIGSFNIQTWNEVYPYNWSLRKDRVTAVLKEYDYDIIGLQEAKEGPMEYMCQDGTFARFGEARMDPCEEYDSETCSIFYRKDKFEVLESATFWLSETPELPSSKSWGTSLARICTWGHFLHIPSKKDFYHFNTHLDHISWDARRAQLECIAKRIRPFAETGKPCFLTGDLNMWPERPELKVLDGLMVSAKEKSETAPSGPDYTFQAFNLNNPKDFLWIDYIYITPNVKVKSFRVADYVVNGLPPADHFPIVATVEF